jgi:hypothetical protein
MHAPRLQLPLSLLAVAACGADPKGTGADSAPPEDPRTRYFGEAVVTDEQVDGDTTTYTFDPASGPACLRGDPYRAAFRDRGSDRLLIFLQGGGACWDDFCLAVTAAPAGIPGVDVLDPALPENPFADWNVLYLPYCDASLFIGDRDHDDDGDGAPDRLHRGLANLTAALDQARARQPAPAEVVFAGSSGGGFGVLLAPPLVRAAFPNAARAVFADSAVGVARGAAEPGFVAHLMDQWGAEALLPPGCGDDCLSDGHLTEVLLTQLDDDPALRVGLFSSWYDLIIGDVFLKLPPADFAAAVEAETGRLVAAHPDRVRRFLIDGRMHTTLLGDASGIVGSDLGAVEVPPEALSALGSLELGELATTATAGGAPFHAWLRAFVDDDPAGWPDLVDPIGPVP